MSSESVVQVKNLGKRYEIYSKPQDRLWQTLWRGRRCFYREFWALRNISLEIRKGESVGVIGANGSGKSTLLRLIAGTLASTEGSVRVQGKAAALLELGSGFDPQFTGRENVFLNGAILGFSKREMEKRFAEIEEFAGIGEFIDRPVKSYSSGMVMRLAFAVSTCVDPQVLLLDEVLAVGDAAFHFKCKDRLDRLLRAGTTLLLVSHDPSLIKQYCKRAIYLSKGRERASGTPQEMVELYMLDLRNEQWADKKNPAPFKLKPHLGGADGIAFGTEEGRVLSAWIGKPGASHAVFKANDTLSVSAEVEFSTTLKNPSYTVMIFDKKQLLIGGHSCRLPVQNAVEGVCRTKIDCSFAARLTRGRYFITLRVADRLTEDNLRPIDKQVALLSFDVQPSENSDALMGPVDLGIQFL